MIYQNVRCFFFSLLVISLSFFAHSQQISLSAAQNNVVITEIMADPLPAVHLPLFEYVELLNNSPADLSTSGWTLTIGKYEVTLPDSIVKSGDYYIVCGQEAANFLLPFGNLLQIQTMPPILNSGQVITLRNSNGKILHSVQFRDSWYKNDQKSIGGWALEMIDPANPCTGYTNWEASRDKKGGTPGKLNSVHAPNPDLDPPKIIRAAMPSDTFVELVFSESMNPLTACSRNNYSINNGILHPEYATPVEPGYHHVLLNYNAPFSPGAIYSVHIRDSLSDCAGNFLKDGYTLFGLPEMPAVYDVIINELMFEGTSEIPEYIEICNRSDHIMDLSSLCISLNDHTGNPSERVCFSTDRWILLPGGYYIITRSLELVPADWINSFGGRIIESASLFRLPDEEGFLAITDTLLNVIDEAFYSRLMHNEVLQDTRGVSLERNNTEALYAGTDNWGSASSLSGFSTPANANSRFKQNDPESEFLVSPETISPDDDGNNDYATIVCRTAENGWHGNIIIYSLEGRKVKTLARNALLGTEEILIWNGKTDEGKLAENGIYIVFGELFSMKGTIKKWKKVVSVVRK